MKRKNIFCGLLTTIMIALLGVGIVSCDDDKNKTSDSDISGTSWVNYDGSFVINFNKDNTGTIVESYTTSIFTYTMTSETEGIMVVKEYDSYSGYNDEVYYFEIKDQKLYIYFKSGALYYTCTKSNSNNGEIGNDISNSSIAGTSWTYDAKLESVTINFKSNGTGTIVEKWYDSYGWDYETMNFTYTMSSKTEGVMVVKEYDSYSGYNNEVYYFEIKGQKLYVYDEENEVMILTQD